MANTFSKIASTTVGSSGASNINFTSIPDNYTDLLIKTSVRTTAASAAGGQWLFINFNGTNADNTSLVLYGLGSSVGSFIYSSPTPYGNYVNPSDYTANTFGSTEIYIPNYASSRPKSFSGDSANETNTTAAGKNLQAGLWNNNSPITSIQLTLNAGNFVQYSTATLYGIKNYS